MTASPTADNEMQDKVFAFLADPARHGEVRRIDTHAASVFLAGDRALKVKRAVRFPYLDYATLAKRRAACEDELRISRPFAPQIYRRVVPITQGADGSLAIDGEGTPVEYAVEMTRFRCVRRDARDCATPRGIRPRRDRLDDDRRQWNARANAAAMPELRERRSRTGS